MINKLHWRARISLTALIIFCLWLGINIGPAVGAANPETYPGKLEIDKGKGLNPAERAVEARFAAYLEVDTDRAIAIYLKKFGNEVNADNARELSWDYAPGGIEATDPASIAGRTLWGSAVHEPASALVKEIYRRLLAQKTPPNKRRQVIFTAGGAGVGKTTSIRAQGELSRAVDAAEIIYDTTLAGFNGAVSRIGQALDAGRMVSIVFVYRDPIESVVDGVLIRAQLTGRTVPLDVLLRSHLGSVETILKLVDKYKNDRRVAFAFIDNRGGIGKAKPAEISFVKAMAQRYTYDDLRAKLSQALREAYEKGKSGGKNGISEAIYRAIAGHAP